MKKQQSIKHTLASALILSTAIACNGQSSAKGGRDAARGDDSSSNDSINGKEFAANESSVGTRGGGGTLVFSFKEAAIAAADVMAANPSISSAPGVGEGLTGFYNDHRELWIKALRNFSSDPKIIEQTDQPLIESGYQVGAQSLPVQNPSRVELSVPYLTGANGFTEAKAFALAIHEAGHFAAPRMSDTEHSYLDQIAVLLYKQKQGAPKLKRSYAFKVPMLSQNSAISSDGRILTVDFSMGIRTINLETGNYIDEDFRPYQVTPNGPYFGKSTLQQNLVVEFQAPGDLLIHNILTNEKKLFQIKPDYVYREVLPDHKTLAVHYSDKSVTCVNLDTFQQKEYAQERESCLTQAEAGAIPFNVASNEPYDRFRITNIKTDEVVDIIRQPGYETEFGCQISPNGKIAALTWIRSQTDKVPAQKVQIHAVDSASLNDEMINGYNFLAFSLDSTRMLLMQRFHGSMHVDHGESSILVKNLEDGSVQRLEFDEDIVTAKFMPNQRDRVMIAFADGQLLVHNLKTGQEEARFLHPSANYKDPVFLIQNTALGEVIITHPDHGNIWTHPDYGNVFVDFVKDPATKQ